MLQLQAWSCNNWVDIYIHMSDSKWLDGFTAHPSKGSTSLGIQVYWSVVYSLLATNASFWGFCLLVKYLYRILSCLCWPLMKVLDYRLSCCSNTLWVTELGKLSSQQSQSSWLWFNHPKYLIHWIAIMTSISEGSQTYIFFFFLVKASSVPKLQINYRMQQHSFWFCPQNGHLFQVHKVLNE